MSKKHPWGDHMADASTLRADLSAWVKHLDEVGVPDESRFYNWFYVGSKMEMHQVRCPINKRYTKWLEVGDASVPRPSKNDDCECSNG